MNSHESVEEGAALVKAQACASLLLAIFGIVLTIFWREVDAVAFACGSAYAFLTIKLYFSIAQTMFAGRASILSGASTLFVKLALFVIFGIFIAQRGASGAASAACALVLALLLGGLLYATSRSADA
jgi:hypothetical protein